MKKRLSSLGTPFWKIFPVIWGVPFAGGLLRAVWELVMAPDNSAAIGMTIVMLLIFLPLAMWCFYTLLPLKSLYLTSDSLLVSNYLKTVEIPLSNIEYVRRPDQSSNPKLISIHLRAPSEFGSKIIFMPPLFMEHEIMEELRSRVGIDRDRPEDFVTGKAQAIFLKRYRDIMKGRKD